MNMSEINSLGYLDFFNYHRKHQYMKITHQNYYKMIISHLNFLQ
jgi:hypothetical protein